MKLKKNTFLQGAFIATLGIIFCKILGMLYVIPFHAIIGEKGGALYGYAYNIYSIFLGLSSAGLPLAMSKIISEYNTLGYYKAKERAFVIGRGILSIIGIISFLILFIFADVIGNIIIGDITGGNSPSDVAFVIRVIATAILVVPILSVYRGYYQGHKYITPTTFSQVIEQITRVLVIVIGSFLLYKIFNLSLRDTVAFATFSATIGGFASFLYLFIKKRKNKQEFIKKPTIKEPKITDQEILRKIIIYAVPFIMIDLFRSLYNSVDIMMLVRTLVNNFGYTMRDAESIMSIISTWGQKINMVIISIVTGVMTSLIPNLTSSFVRGDKKEVNERINKTYQIVFFLALPMTVGLSLIARPVWTIFYGNSAYGAITYQYLVFVAFATTIFTSTVTIAQVMKEYKIVFVSLITGMLVKIILNVPLLYAFSKMGLPAFYGSISATILGFIVSAIISIVFLKSKYQLNYESTIKEIINILLAIIVMSLIITILKIFIPVTTTSRLLAILLTFIYSIIGATIYLVITMKTKTITNIFGNEFILNIKKKLKRK